MTEGAPGAGEGLKYQRCRFTAEILRDRMYTRDHYWMKEEAGGVWRVGLTPWAVRMLGDLVEYQWGARGGDRVEAGGSVGSLEGFKAVVEIRAVATGTFVEGNPVLAVNLDAVTLDCYGGGWLYVVEGVPEGGVCDAAAYRRVLDETIDMLRGAGQGDVN
jgi:glycine cleavage system H protein